MSRSITLVLGTCVAVVLLYVASIGPAAWLNQHELLPGNVGFWEPFYRPVFWTCECNDTAYRLLMDYVNWGDPRFDDARLVE